MSSKRIINIIDSLRPVNYGIWNAALSTASILREKYMVESVCWHPENDDSGILPENVKSWTYNQSTINNLSKLETDYELNPKQDIIISHGAWRYPTKLGVSLKQRGYFWVYTPHGMLEPWSLQQKKWKKYFYFHLIEKKIAKKADYVRAVGTPESINLSAYFNNVITIPNGVPKLKGIYQKDETKVVFLFMARLHHKKGVLALVNAWATSFLNNKTGYQLVIAGPDDGELKNLLKLLNQIKSTNIDFRGAVYGDEKNTLLKQSHFYVLPSQSEGFPTSILETMQYGIIPIITEGCNFPETFENKLAVKIGVGMDEIQKGIEKCSTIPKDIKEGIGTRCIEFIDRNYTLQAIANNQMKTYENGKWK